MVKCGYRGCPPRPKPFRIAPGASKGWVFEGAAPSLQQAKSVAVAFDLLSPGVIGVNPQHRVWSRQQGRKKIRSWRIFFE